MTGTWESQNPIRINDRDGSVDGFKLVVDVSDAGKVEMTLYPAKKSLQSFKFKGLLRGNIATAELSDVGSQGTDTGRITLAKKGSVLEANINFTINGAATYSYDDFLDK